MKTILLTGASGFIGGNLLQSLKNHPIYGKYKIVLLGSAPVPGHTTLLHKNYTFSKADFADKGISEVDIVFHLGAFAPKEVNNANNIEAANSNITSLTHLLENLPNVPSRFIFASTVDVYKQSETALTEDNITEPWSLYGWSKLYGEKVLEAWASQRDTVIQVMRIGHIYGRGEEKYNKIIPLSIRKLLHNEKIVIFSNGAELRSLLHVTDCARAIIAAAELSKYEGPINVASSQAISIKEIATTISSIMKAKDMVEIQGKPIEVRNMVFNNSKMYRLLAKEEVVFADGIKDEIEHFRF
ncbi:MAG: NAD-dependent epimerase/dehydratase [Flaviaesturariibacter sp.]|nr:NAD-dependent epimerase/dehydratase [Flaviaesturariibacter sp.]